MGSNRVDNKTLKEEAEIKIKELNKKTPMAVLNELLTRRGISPQYQSKYAVGPAHKPVFCYHVTVVDIDGTRICTGGKGASIKEAKQAAAKAVLQKIVEGGTEEESALSDNEAEENSSGSTQNTQGSRRSPDEGKIMNNPIGALQEKCIACRWPLPLYSGEKEEGMPHEKKFSITCSLLQYRQVGQGVTKKMAKTQAALKMWQFLKERNFNLDNTVGQQNKNKEDTTMYTRREEWNNDKIIAAAQYYGAVLQFRENLASSKGEQLRKLREDLIEEEEIDCVQILEELAAEQSIKVTYLDIGERRISDFHQCLVQLTTLPVAVCYGSGTTTEEARTIAARSALEYLKLMASE